ncbi:predicted protein [Chaetoceros tenuissimus]|uniref:Uncharacterized protein n=1 Tax=Chaetoceros tenuissimus TaxID=426638 RepID=A0AAD3H8U6_9STRA|nr:predicted protein [Chaetoceros tenuissimus]
MIGFSRTVALLAFVGNAAAFAPSMNTQAIAKQTQLQMGLFDFFLSEEERENLRKQEEAKKAEEEEALRLMMERRRNPEKMEEYEAKVVVRRDNYKKMKTRLEEQQNEIYVDDEDN